MPLLDNYVPVRGSDYSGGIVGAMEQGFDPYMRRPYIAERGRYAGMPCVTVNAGRWTVEKGVRRPVRERVPVAHLMMKGHIDPIFLTANASALRKEQWIELDKAVVKASRQRLVAWGDLESSSSVGGFNAMGRMTFEYESMSDPGEAVVDMDGMSPARTDSPLFRLRSLPLPITHSDFWFAERRLQISRNGDTPLDTTMAEAAGRRVAEKIERLTIGLDTAFNFGDVSTGVTAHDTTAGTYTGTSNASSVYGYLNFPHRITKTDITAPTAGGWSPSTTVSEVLACRELLFDNFHYGDVMIYHSTDWDRYLDDDHYLLTTSGAVAPSRTLRSRLMDVKGIKDIKRLDFLTASSNPFTMIFVELGNSEVARAINGMAITTVQWPSIGGLRHNFKVMCIQVPNLRADYNGRTGILVATTS